MRAPRHCEQGPMSLGSSASFRRIVPSRDTSTTESEIPSFRDAKPHESWELVPLGELSLSGILQLRNQRFQVSGMQSPMSLGSSASFRRIVPFRDTSTMESKIPSFRDAKPKQSLLAPRHCEQSEAILSTGKKIATPPWGSQ